MMNMTIYNYIKMLLCLVLMISIGHTAHARNISAVEGHLTHLIQSHENAHLEFNTLLSRAAEIQAGQIFIAEFASDRSEAGATEIFTVKDAGYLAEDSRQMTAMVVFSNYLSSDMAATLLFNTLLDTYGNDENGFRLIPDSFSEIGLHVLETSISFSGSRFNVYLAVVNFAVPVRGMVQTRVMENQLLNLMNQARKVPSDVMAWHKIDTSWPIFFAAAPPLIGMPLDTASVVLTHTLASDDINRDNMVASLFYFMLLDDRIMDRAFTVVDISVEQQMVQLEGRFEMNYTATVRLDRADICHRVINGVVFSDLNGNELYDAGEEHPYIPLFINDAGIHSRTGAAGNFSECLDTDKGIQLILFPDNQDVVVWDIDRNEKDQYILIILK